MHCFLRNLLINQKKKKNCKIDGRKDVYSHLIQNIYIILIKRNNILQFEATL